jgi:hypothetical protein
MKHVNNSNPLTPSISNKKESSINSITPSKDLENSKKEKTENDTKTNTAYFEKDVKIVEKNPSEGNDKIFLCSSEDEIFFVFCIILDLDEKGDGAADVQLQFGSLNSDLSRESMSNLFSSNTIQNIRNTHKQFVEFRQFIPLLRESALIIDHSMKLPFVTLNHSFSNVDETESSKKMKSLHRDNIVLNKNVFQWIGVLESILPKIFSICIRISSIQLNFLESEVIRDFIYSKIQFLVDRFVILLDVVIFFILFLFFRAALRPNSNQNLNLNMIESAIIVMSNILFSTENGVRY